MLMNMVKSRKVKDDKSTYKEKITFAVTPYQLVGKIQDIEEDLWELNKKCKRYSLDGLFDRMCFLMNRFRIICGESFFLM